MAKAKIEPRHVTRPIQLLAAWLAGLVLIEGIFLGAAAIITQPSWAAGALVIASIFNVPIFLASIFLLQTRYRPEMQEDTYYSKYLDTKIQRREASTSTELSEIRSDIYKSDTRTLEIINTIQRNLSSFVGSVQDTPLAASEEIDEDLRHLKIEVDAISGSIEDVKDQALWERYKIEVNDLLPKFRQIFEALIEASIPIDGLFGSTSDGKTTPPVGILTFGPDVDIRAIARMFELTAEFGVTAVSYADEYYDLGRIYVGSYIYEQGEETYVAVDGEIAAVLADPDSTTEVFVDLVEASTKRPPSRRTDPTESG